MAIPLSDAQVIYDNFWKAAPALKAYKEQLLYEWESNDKEYIVGPDFRKLVTRSPHSILNVIFQHSGVLAMKRAMIYFDHWIKEEKVDTQQLIAYHDESQIEVEEQDVKIKEFDSKEKAETWKAKWEKKNSQHLSNVFKRNGEYAVAKCRAGHLQVKSILKGGEFYGYNVPLTSGWDLGKNWSQCH